MIYFSDLLRQKYSEYANIDNKVSRDIKNGKYIKIVKGLYEDDKKDVLPFIKDASKLNLWSKEFFINITDNLN